MNKMIAALVAFGTLGILLTLATTSALFTDQGNSTGNSAAAATMQVPALTAVASGTQVILNWTNPDTLGTGGGFTIVRGAGACPVGAIVNPTPVASVAAGTTSIADNPPGSGTQSYCYGVNGVLYNWVSAQGKAAASVTFVTPIQLSHPSTSSFAIVKSGATGAPVFLDANNKGNVFETWSGTPFTVTGRTGWELNLNVGNNPTNNFSTSGTTIDAYVYMAASCSTTVPSASNLIAQTLLAPIVLGNNALSLTATGTLLLPSTGNLCVRIANHSSDNGQAHGFTVVVAGGVTNLTGPVN